MSLAAVDGIEDALAATKQFLLPFDVGRWLRLAVIAFFVGGAGGGTSGGGNVGSGGSSTPDVGGVPELALTDTVLVLVLIIAALLVLLGLAYAAVGAVMEFVLVESLRQEAVHLRRYAGQYWRAGLRLFGFRLGVGLLALLGVGGVLGVGFLAAGGAAALQSPGRLVGIVLLAVPILLVVALATAVVLGLTTDFVVPVMLLEGTTVLGGWRRFWPTLRAEWREYAVYVLVAFVLRLGAGLVVGIVAGLLAVALFVPFGAVGVAVFVAGGGQLSGPVVVALALLGLVALFAMLVAWALVGVPVVTYFRYYALLVLGDTEPDFDVIADRRATIRQAEASD